MSKYFAYNYDGPPFELYGTGANYLPFAWQDRRQKALVNR
jgi:hypothetical protein